MRSTDLVDPGKPVFASQSGCCELNHSMYRALVCTHSIPKSIL